MFQAIIINREELTIMGVEFEDSNTFESTANALGSNMFEGFEPTPKGIRIIKEYVEGQITLEEMVALAKAKAYV
jgi:putative transcriptional regulator